MTPEQRKQLEEMSTHHMRNKNIHESETLRVERAFMAGAEAAFEMQQERIIVLEALSVRGAAQLCRQAVQAERERCAGIVETMEAEFTEDIVEAILNPQGVRR